jgi:hypothetical protein
LLKDKDQRNLMRAAAFSGAKAKDDGLTGRIVPLNTRYGIDPRNVRRVSFWEAV